MKKKWTKKFSLWLEPKKPAIKAEIKSIIHTFLGGMAFYLFMNWGHITTTTFDAASALSLAGAAIRSGVKALWLFLEPQVLSLLKLLISYLPSKK